MKNNKTVRNLGVVLDQCLNMDAQVTNICRGDYCHLENIRSIRPLLTPEALKTVVHAFISSRLDYCNSLLLGVSETLIQRLQRIQNITARIVTNSSKYDHITEILKMLHWLPIRQRIAFKVILLTYRSLNGTAPKYISELLTVRTHSLLLRSSSQLTLVVPPTRLKGYGDSSFTACAPRLWNSLPSHIRDLKTIEQFKKQLKTHLFNQTFI